MEKKTYVSPNIINVEMQTLDILAASGLSSDGTTADFETTNTDNAINARVASQQYFDAWSEDDEE